MTGRRRDLVAWNAAAADILGFDDLPEDGRNLLVSMLTNPRSRQLFGDGWAAEAERMVAAFRATHDLWAGDPAFIDLLRRLREGCPEFDAWWERHDVRRGALRPQSPAPPDEGESSPSTTPASSSPTTPGLKLVIYTPVPLGGGAA